MPKFDTPEPITATVEPGVGSVTVVAGARVDTTVEIRPTNADKQSDIDAAERTTVDFAGNTLTIRGSKINPLIGPNKKTGSIDVIVELPAGSHIHGKSGMGDLTATGRLGDVSYKTGLGDVKFDEAATLSVTSGTGTVLGNRMTGKATITTAGRLHVGELAAGGVLKNSNGVTVVGAARGPVKVRSANGDITVEEAADDVEVDAVKHHLVPVGLVQPTGGYRVHVFPLAVSGAADGDVAERGVGVDLDLVGMLRGRAGRGHLVAHPAELGRDVQPRGAASTDTDLDLTHRGFQRE